MGIGVTGVLEGDATAPAAHPTRAKAQSTMTDEGAIRPRFGTGTGARGGGSDVVSLTAHGL
jgi:hypothetical protein